MKTGDVVLFRMGGLSSFLIRNGQKLRYKGKDAHFAGWTHCGVATGHGDEFVEAVHTGVRTSLLNRDRSNYAIVNPGYISPEDQTHILGYLKRMAGHGYGFTAIASIAFDMVTGSSLDLSDNGEVFCSVLVSNALNRAGFEFPRDVMTPGDLAAYFQVQ